MEDRPEFPVEVPEWDLTGDNAAIVRQADSFTVSKIEESCDGSAHGKALKGARLIVDCCVDPKFGPEHIEALATAKSATAVGRLVTAILVGPKKNISSSD